VIAALAAWVPFVTLFDVARAILGSLATPTRFAESSNQYFWVAHVVDGGWSMSP